MQPVNACTSDLTPKCLGCGSRSSTPFFAGPDRMHGKSDVFTMWRCLKCETVFLFPHLSPKELLNHYPSDYLPYQLGYKLNRLAKWSLKYGVRKQVRTVLRHTNQTGRAIDIGCGGGDFIAAVGKQTWQVTGLEVNPKIAIHARQKYYINMVIGDSLQTGFQAKSFHLITLWDVLEHLHDPRLALQEMARIASPGALLVISVPDIESYEAHWFRTYWAGWDIPRHLWLFPQSVLKRLLNECGWQVQQVSHFRGRHWLWAQSMRFWLDDIRISQRLRNILLTIINSWITRILLLPYFIVVEKQQKSSIMVIFAERKP